jgi:hypothetical protein
VLRLDVLHRGTLLALQLGADAFGVHTQRLGPNLHPGQLG